MADGQWEPPPAGVWPMGALSWGWWGRCCSGLRYPLGCGQPEASVMDVFTHLSKRQLLWELDQAAFQETKSVFYWESQKAASSTPFSAGKEDTRRIYCLTLNSGHQCWRDTFFHDGDFIFCSLPATYIEEAMRKQTGSSTDRRGCFKSTLCLRVKRARTSYQVQVILLPQPPE
nr:uncharacterized protein LOC105488057 isoform X2 [Macaca nemestrina]